MPDLIASLALVAGVFILAGLLSGVAQRTPFSFPLIFLSLGFLLGQWGLGLIDIDLDSTSLEVIAVVTLCLVLYYDAIRIGAGFRGGENNFVPVRTLGPGTLITISISALGAHLLLGTTLVNSLILGAVLASTDPVILEDVVRDERIPRPVRQALNIEAGTNDIVILPILLTLIALSNTGFDGFSGWLLFGFQVLLIGPVVGFMIGTAGAWLMNKVAAARYSVDERYRAFYGISLALLAYASAQALGGDGFLAAFGAGFAVARLGFEVSDRSLDYGDSTSGMTMLLTFTLFGVVISSAVSEVPLLPTLVLAVIVIFVSRPAATALVLGRISASRKGKMFIGWFGPRGLSSLLLILIVVDSGVANSGLLFAAAGVVVSVSVLLHGSTAVPLSTLYGRAVEKSTHQEEREGTAAGMFANDVQQASRISADELAGLLKEDSPPIILDVRTRSQYTEDAARIAGSIRVKPDTLEEWADTWREDHPESQVEGQRIVAYCT